MLATINMDTPLPLEQTDPELAEHLRLIANGQHAVKQLHISQQGFVFYLQDGTRRIKRIDERQEKVGRNDPCPCGSNKKFKKCCLTS
jgi:uncharacterized protein YecA (UPF0149 family)